MNIDNWVPVYDLTDNQYCKYLNQLKEYCDQIAIYGSNPLSQALNPQLSRIVEEMHTSTDMNEMQEMCLRALALYWLIRQYNPYYFNYTAANAIPRALSLTGFRGAFALLEDIGVQDKVLIPYINEYLGE